MTPVPLWRRYDRLLGSDPSADVKDELRFHLETKVDDLVAEGWSPEDARKEAERQFGDILAVQHVGERIGEHMDRRRRLTDYWADALREVRFTLRTLRRDAGFTVIVVLILTLAIGANIAVFAVVNTLLLRPLPFPDAHQLVWIAPAPHKCGFACSTYSADAYNRFRAQSRSYQGVTGYYPFATADNLRLTGHGDPQPVTGIMVVGNFFAVLGVQPVMGRLFMPAELQHGAPPVVLLSNAYWRRQFASDPAIVGKPIDLSGMRTAVIGVLPASFDFGAVFSPGTKTDLFQPLILEDARTFGSVVTMLGRLKPGVTLAQAQAEGTAVEPHLCWRDDIAASCGAYSIDIFTMRLRTLKDYVVGRSAKLTHRPLVCRGRDSAHRLRQFLQSAARPRRRPRQGVRRSWRSRCQPRPHRAPAFDRKPRPLLHRGILSPRARLPLAAMAGAPGVASALPLFSSLRIDGAALEWTALTAAFATLLCGLVPALRMADGQLREALKDTSAGAGQGRSHQRIRSLLVVSEVALACMLLVGAGLLLRSFVNVLDVDLGFEPDRAAAIMVDYDDGGSLPNAKVEDVVARRTAIFQQILSKVGTLPGVTAAGMVDYLPMEQDRESGAPIPKGSSYRQSDLPNSLVYVVSPGYFQCDGHDLRGARLTSTRAEGPGVIILDEPSPVSSSPARTRSARLST